MELKLQVLLLWLTCLMVTIQSSSPSPSPLPWPEQFHALVFMNLTNENEIHLTDLWYDWPRGRNVNIHHKQLGEVLYAVEWNNGTSFYYTLGAGGTCRVTQYEVGIPRPDFLAEGSVYLGTQVTDGFLCHVWEKADFIWYYQDVLTSRLVRWDFAAGITNHVMTFEVGAVLPDSVTQAPAYCFNQISDI
ncbi:transferring glycosyl group transferase [Trema orientale]|uniref:Transferring glycosyl group transferase n=1 Tax=Trema orientale TaxID=63057 RepID=A0A2P5FJL2_TREOI|nr:transferring glycosyl group transferase [Trema orientale]